MFKKTVIFNKKSINLIKPVLFCSYPGACDITALIDEKEQKLYVANLGDCRAVLSRNGKDFALSEDHKASSQKEINRIESLPGGVVSVFDPVNKPNSTLRVQGILAPSRAFGDFGLRPYVSSEPEIKEFSLTKDDEFLILASDGLWDKGNNDSVIGFARKWLLEGSSIDEVAKKLTGMALFVGSKDNITVMVVLLKKVSEFSTNTNDDDLKEEVILSSSEDEEECD